MYTETKLSQNTHWPFYWVDLFKYLLTYVANQLITWPQLNAFRDVDVFKTH